MLDEKTLGTLMVEIHRAIKDATSRAVTLIGDRKISEADISYPPGAKLEPHEVVALHSLRCSEAARSAIEKVVADACAAAFFDTFCLMDAVGDPEMTSVRTWLGVDLTSGISDDPSFEMLHDQFFETYWEYDKIAKRLAAKEAPSGKAGRGRKRKESEGEDKNTPIRTLVERFAETVVKYGKANEACDPRTTNQLYTAYDRLWKMLLERGEEGRKASLSLLSHPNPWVRLITAFGCLDFAEDKGMRILKELERSPGLLGLGAKMCMREWRSRQSAR